MFTFKLSHIIVGLCLALNSLFVLASAQSDDAVINSMLSCKPITPTVFRNYLPFKGNHVVLNVDSEQRGNFIDFSYKLPRPILIKDGIYLLGIYSNYMGDTTTEFYVFNGSVAEVKHVFQQVYQKDITKVRLFGKYVARKLMKDDNKTVIACVTDEVHGIAPLLNGYLK